jgi:hypothetical protein
MLVLSSLSEHPEILPRVSVTKNKSSSLTVSVGCGLSLITQGHSEIGISSAGTKVFPSRKILSGVVSVSGVISQYSVYKSIFSSLLVSRQQEKRRSGKIFGIM